MKQTTTEKNRLIKRYNKNDEKYIDNHRCIFCDKKKVYTHTVKIPPLGNDDNHTVCYKCHDDIFLQMKSKYRDLF